MSRPEDTVGRAARRAEAAVPTAGVMEHLTRRRRRHGVWQRASSVMLVVAVLGGTSLGISLLDRVFRPASTGGQVAFVRLLRPCPAHPNVVRGGLDVFAIDVATGEERLVSHVEYWPDDTLRSEDWPDFTPDGSRYVWVDHYRDDLYVTEILTGNTSKLAGADDLVPEGPAGFLADPPGIGPPQVSPDGTRVLFQAGGGDPVDPDLEVQEIQDTSSIYLVDVSGTSPPVRLAGGVTCRCRCVSCPPKASLPCGSVPRA